MVGVHIKDMFKGKLFSVSRNMQILGEAVLPQVEMPQDVKDVKYRK